MSSVPPSSPHPSEDPYGQTGAPGHYGQPGDYGQPNDYGQSGGYGQPASEHGQPTNSSAPGPQWEAGASSAGGPAPAPGPTLPQGSPSQGAAPAPAGPAPGTDLAADLGGGLKFAGQAMLRNPAAYLVSGLIYTVLILVILVGSVVAGVLVSMNQIEARGYAGEPTFGNVALMLAVTYGLMLLAVPISLLWQAGAARSGVVVLEGGRPSIGQTMAGPWRIILTALLSGAIIAIGTLLLYLPGLIATVLLFYAIPASARGASPIEALKESFRLATKNLGTTIVAYLVIGVASSIASMVILPLIILIPFFVLFQLGMYERVNGRAPREPSRT